MCDPSLSHYTFEGHSHCQEQKQHLCGRSGLVSSISWKPQGRNVSAEEGVANWINYIAPLALIKDVQCVTGVFLFSVLSAAHFPSANTENINKGFHQITINARVQLLVHCGAESPSPLDLPLMETFRIWLLQLSDTYFVFRFRLSNPSARYFLSRIILLSKKNTFLFTLWIRITFTPPPLTSPRHPPCCLSTPCSLNEKHTRQNNRLNPTGAAHVWMGEKPSTKGSMSKANLPSHCRQPLTVNNFSAGLGSLCASFPSVWSAGWLDLVRATTATISSWLQWSCHVQRTLLHPSLPWHLPFSVPLFTLFPEPWKEKKIWYRCPIMSKHSTDTGSPHFDQLWVSAQIVLW